MLLDGLFGWLLLMAVLFVGVRFPNVTITTRLEDCHFYIMSPQVFSIMEEEAKVAFFSIKGDLIPYLGKQP